MNYREYRPAEALVPHVKCIWMLEGVVQGGRERILPDGCIELIFNFGDAYTQHLAGDSARQPVSFIHGQLEHFIEITPSGRTGIVGIRFFPCGLSAFLPVPVHEFTQAVVDTADVFGSIAEELEDRLLYATEDAIRLALVNQFLLQRLRARSRVAALAAAAERINRLNGNTTMKSVAEYACMSERQLERGFRDLVGLSPKAFARIARLQHVLRCVNSGNVDTMSQLAYSAGYYDPAHFVRDFRDLSGMPPAEFFSSRHDMADLFITS